MWLWMSCRSVWGSNDKSVLAFREPHGKLITDLVGFFGGDFSGFERLPNLICDHITFSACAQSSVHTGVWRS